MTIKQLKKRVELWQERLGLPMWRITIGLIGEAEADEIACIHKNYDDAEIRFVPWLLGVEEPPHTINGRRYLEDPERYLDVTIVHELLHLHFARMCDMSLNDFKGIIKADTRKLFKSFYDREEEEIVDRLANALVDSFRKAEM